ncbi:MAG: tolB protein [Myxococcales bacterium FL481]|nr:MAG: tolB protein [Myxococcales bacterium FL481]
MRLTTAQRNKPIVAEPGTRSPQSGAVSTVRRRRAPAAGVDHSLPDRTPHSSGRRRCALHAVAGGLATLLLSAGVSAPDPDPAHASPKPAAESDAGLGELVVTASDKLSVSLVLPRIGVVADDGDARRMRNLIARDLDLSGEFEVIELAAPEATADQWREEKVRFLVRVSVASRPDRRYDGGVELVDVVSQAVVFESRRTLDAAQLRGGGHEFSDRIIEAVTGDLGSFHSRLTFVGGDGKRRQVHVIDPDGMRLETISPPEHVAAAPAFGPNEQLFYLASVERHPFRLFRAGMAEPVDIGRSGSLYGLAFSPDRKSSALSIATPEGIRVIVGRASFDGWTERTGLLLALHPSFDSDHQLAYAGTRKRLQRVYVGERAVSIAGYSASSPTFCHHPGGTRLVYSVGTRRSAHIVVSDLRGRDPVRLTQTRGRHTAPACSPDGRLIAFFSTRTSGEGPGLYVMRLDGRRPRKIADVLGHSLRWSNRNTLAP